MSLLLNKKHRVLVVDDEPSVCHSVRLLLVHAGYDVTTAWSSIEARAILETKPFDLVVTDFTMPGMKGDELAVIIKQRWPHTSVVMLTACAASLCSAARPLPGVDALLEKPFEVAKLRSTIVEVLAGKAHSFTGATTPASGNP